MNKLLRTMSVAALLVASSASFAQVVVVAGAKSPETALNADQVAALYLGKTASLPSGATAVLVDQPTSAPVYEQFYGKVTGKTAAQVKATWSRLVFSGKAAPPKEAANSADVKKLVAGNPAAIGYIEKSAVDSSVKVLLNVD
jgi:ABC-type phosphate transport system substrate-binding protein